MGMFDYLRCDYPLPEAGTKPREYQTKSLGCDMDRYEIRADGTLWHEDYDIEDRSDPAATGLLAIRGMATHVNQRWEPDDYTGEVRFYDCDGDDFWLEFIALFVGGKLRHVECTKAENLRAPPTASENPHEASEPDKKTEAPHVASEPNKTEGGVGLPEILRILADWEDREGTLAAITLEEWSGLHGVITDAACEQSPRQIRTLWRRGVGQARPADGRVE